MGNSTRIIQTKSLDPWWNLSVEEYLLNTVAPGQCILYLWQNENTVVIGRNQNPWRECRAELLESEGGKLARRLSGGGAVFHDTGNLNFTFVADRDTYNLDKQSGVILDAVNALGVRAEKSGRNDLLAEGRKFSGNAFCFRKNSAYHHGTILVCADMDRLSGYLQVSAEKMRSKGIQSVQSRVVNLAWLKPGLTVAEVADALIGAFRTSYESQAPVEGSAGDGSESREALEELYCKYSSWAWRYGEAPGFDVDMETRFPWGGVELGFRLTNGVVDSVKAYSDAMDEAFIAKLPGIMKGCAFSSRELARRLREAVGFSGQVISGSYGDYGFVPDAQKAMALDLADWLEQKRF